MGGGKRCGANSHLLHCGQNVATEAFAWIQFIYFSFFLIAMGVMAGIATRRGDRLSTPVAMV